MYTHHSAVSLATWILELVYDDKVNGRDSGVCMPVGIACCCYSALAKCLKGWQVCGG